jgi:hypothetical protein
MNPASAPVLGRRCASSAALFVISGYTMGTKSFDVIVFGYYDGGTLMYAGRDAGWRASRR